MPAFEWVARPPAAQPSADRPAALVPGMVVMAHAVRHREDGDTEPAETWFWVRITQIDGDHLSGTIENTLVRRGVFGVLSGDPVVIERRHVRRLLGQD